jgi:hypothetical protein
MHLHFARAQLTHARPYGAGIDVPGAIGLGFCTLCSMAAAIGWLARLNPVEAAQSMITNPFRGMLHEVRSVCKVR